jgi:outer membrane protein OmpA-like peptidoglycan-associated protein
MSTPEDPEIRRDDRRGKSERLRGLVSLVGVMVWVSLWGSGCTAVTKTAKNESPFSNQELMAEFRRQQLTVREQGNGVILVVPYVLFTYKSATLTPEARQLLSGVASTLANPQAAERKIAVEGHTDSVGSHEYNRKLSLERAQAVAQELIAGGVSKGRIKVEEYGEEIPIAPNKSPKGEDNPEGRAENRRVEIVILQ